MLCPNCHRQLERGASYCRSCGAPQDGAAPPLELVLPDRTRLTLVGDLTIGRAADSQLQLADPSVSRAHARIRAGDGGDTAVLTDAGSSYGTWLDGRRLKEPAQLHDGDRIQLGDQELLVERRRRDSEAGHTVVVPPDASLVLKRDGGASAMQTAATRFGRRPRVRSGYALKRLEAAEGDRRWVLKDLREGQFARMSDADAKLFELLDGERTLAELVRESEARLGPTGPARLAQLLADLTNRGLLADTPGTEDQDGPAGRLGRLARPRKAIWSGAGDWFDRVYRAGGWILFTRTALKVLGAVAVVGAIVFVYLVAGRYGTPFVVASKIGIGGLVFLVGRFLVAAVHETAHGLAMSSFGRRVHEAGLKLVLIFPYAYLDTSDAWFEPRRRRIAVSAAGPVSDLTLGGAFSICCLALPAGTLREVLFQLAFGAYVGAFFNLNPFLDRDGYQMLVDLLREPGLRQRARAQWERRLSGGRSPADSRVLRLYSLFGLAWSALGAAIAVGMSLRYESSLTQFVPGPVVWAGLAAIWIALFIPVMATLGRPLLRRRRGATAEMA